MVPDSLKYAYSRDPSEADTAEIAAVWSRWWDQVQDADRQRAARKEPLEYPPLSGQRQRVLEERFAAMLNAPSRPRCTAAWSSSMPRGSSLSSRPTCGSSCKSYSTHDAPRAGRGLDRDGRLRGPAADDGRCRRRLAGRGRQVADNWLLHFRYRRDRYQPGFWRKSWYIVADTQYAHLVARLATFHFGRSALRTREPVAGRIWNAVLVSAPIMLLSEALIYLVAVPLGILCAVGHGRWIDRAISLGLFCSTRSRPSWRGCSSWSSSATATTCGFSP